MGQLTDQPFRESCCDGGAAQANSKSCQPCGCDLGANYFCTLHYGAGSTVYGINKNNPAWEPFVAASNSAKRKEYPIATGVIDYFPDAIMEIAHVSFVGNQQHHADKPLHWDRSKSSDEADACMRHFKDRGTLDTDGVRHTAKACWRLLALLQKELEQEKK